VFSARQIAEKLGVPIERVEADIERFIAPERLHRGPSHPIQ
jgi:DNA-directed RNA polymerase specialized sigma24 family protein